MSQLIQSLVLTVTSEKPYPIYHHPLAILGSLRFPFFQFALYKLWPPLPFPSVRSLLPRSRLSISKPCCLTSLFCVKHWRRKKELLFSGVLVAHWARLVYQSFCDHSIGIFHSLILSFEGFVRNIWGNWLVVKDWNNFLKYFLQILQNFTYAKFLLWSLAFIIVRELNY